MSELVTLTKGSAEFRSYLLGTFSKERRALPQQTLNPNSQNETVTFKIVPLSQIRRPSLISYFVQTFKVKNFLLVLFPLFLIVVKNIADNTLMDPLSATISTLGVLCAFVSLNLRNDYNDHLQGIDRVLQERGSRAIQNGWATAEQVKKYSLFFLILALLCALPVIVTFPSVLAVVAVSALTGLWAYQLGGELSLFLLLGPLLTVGYQLSMGMFFDIEALALGLMWGWLVLYLVHLKNLTCIIESSQAQFKNTVNRLGFDRSRRLIAAWWCAFVLFYAVYHVFYASLLLGLYGTLLLIFISFRFIGRMKKLSSPAGSEMKAVYEYGRRLFQVAVILWTLENFWYLLAR
jgi:1,4-dihydroxy-2-naphthoate octaprenyltransferase